MPSRAKIILRKINRGYQITLPPDFRDRYRLNIGDHVEMVEKNGLLVISPLGGRREKISRELATLFSENPESELSDEDTMQLAIREIKAARAERNKNRSAGDE